MLKTSINLLLSATLLLGCTSGSVQIPQQSVHEPLIEGKRTALAVVRGATYVREVKEKSSGDGVRVSFTQANISLKDALTKPITETGINYGIIPRDLGVDLGKKISVRSYNMAFKDYLELLESLTGYEIELDGGVVNISSFVVRTWNVAAFADTRRVSNNSTQNQSGSVNTGSGVSKTSVLLEGVDEDEFDELIKSARNIIGAKLTEDDDDQENQDDPALSDVETVTAMAEVEQLKEAIEREPYVHGLRSAGIITAGGVPSDIAALDTFIRTAVKTAQAVFNIQVQAYEVVLEHSKQKGIDWDILKKGGLNGMPLDFELGKNSSDSDSANNSLWSMTGSYASGDSNVNLMLKFLETFGRVELTSQPNITVRNGVPAMITRGTEFSFVADFEQSVNESGSATVTPTFDRLTVGVTLAVTPRLLEDNLIQLDIWPIISTVTGNDKFDVDGFEFQTPIISLQEFTTQVIASSGESIQLGGLISKKIIKQIEGLPIVHKPTKQVASIAFDDEANSIERSELVMTVTPTLVEGIY